MNREPNKSIKIGVVGAGMVSQIAHLPSIAASSHVIGAGIADLDLNLAKQVGLRFGYPIACDSHKALFTKAALDAVVVVTHRSVTAAIVRDALQQGIHVLSEKPMAMTLSVAKELVGLAEKQGRVYAIGFMKRYDRGVNKARQMLAELLASKKLGKLIMVRGKNFCAEYVGQCDDYIRGPSRPSLPPTSPMVPEWLDPAFRGHYDWFANVGLHSVNLLRYLLERDLRCQHAELRYTHSMSILLDAAGVPASLDVGKSATGRWEESFEFFFERGRLELQLTSLKQKHCSASVTLDENVGETKTHHFSDNTCPWGFDNQMQAFVDTVRGSSNGVLATGVDSLKDMELMEEIFMKGQRS